jgi:hypothetical protein
VLGGDEGSREGLSLGGGRYRCWEASALTGALFRKPEVGLPGGGPGCDRGLASVITCPAAGKGGGGG